MVINDIESSGGPSALRRVHRALAMKELFRSGSVSRTVLAERLGLSTMAISRIVRELVDRDLVREAGTADRTKGPGRPQTNLELNPDGIYAAGIVASAYYKSVAIVNGVGDIVAERSVSISNVRSGPETVRDLCEALLDLLTESRLPLDRLIGFGGALAAVVDPVAGVVVSADYLGWQPFSLTDEVASFTDIPFLGENIANALNRAETYVGVAQDENTVALIHAATTVGASFSANGQLLRGADSKVGRIGHLPYEETGLTCSCGRHDCLNSSASGWSILSRLGIIRKDGYDPKSVELYAAEIEKIVSLDIHDQGRETPNGRTFFRAGRALGKALWQVALLYGPEKIVLAGAMARAPSYVAGVRAGLADFGPEGAAVAQNLVVSSMSPARAGALVALEDLVHSPKFDIDRIGQMPTSGGAMRRA